MITRTLRGVGALTVLALLLVGWPVAMLALADAVSKWLPDLSDPAGLLARPDAGGLFLLIVLAVGWIAWAVWAAALLVEAAAQVRGVPTPLLGGLFPQHAAAALVTAIAVAFAAAPTAALAAPTAAPAAPAAAGVAEAAPAQAPHAVRGEHHYTVERGDTLWDIAAEQLDDPDRWTEIADASRGIAQPDGHYLDDPRVIRPGWTLNIPTIAEPADVTEAGPQTSDDEGTAPEDDGLTLPPTPLHAPAGDSETDAAPTSAASDVQSDRSAAEDDAIPLPPTPLRPPAAHEASGGAQAAGLPSTPMSAETAAATIDDEGRSSPIHGVLGLPEWVTDPLIPTTAEAAPDLVAAIRSSTSN